MKKEFILIVLAVLFILATAAYAQMAMVPMACGPTASLIKMLEGKYNEQVIGFGPTRSGDLARLYASEKTFTFLITLRDGTSCMAAGGDIWETLNVTRGRPT